jgi:hypothetical protein
MDGTLLSIPFEGEFLYIANGDGAWILSCDPG